MRHGVVLVGRRAFQLYAILVLGMFLYLHLCRNGRPARVVLSSGGVTSGVSRSVVLSGNLERSSRFILSLNYWEQFTMATANLLSLVCLGDNWNATTVQPFTYNSRLYGLRNFKPGIMTS